MNTESIKKLGWPYNLYSAISGLSIPDDTTTKSYYYKYQKGYYCFFLTRPEEAHKKMMEFLNRFYYFKYNTIGLSAIIHKYGFGKSYDEIVTMYNNHDIRYYSPILAFDRFADSLFSRDITVRDLIKYEAYILRELRLYRPYNDYLRCWPDDITRPEYRKFITPNDRLKLYALSNKRFGYGLFTINSTKLVSKDIDFSEYLTNIIDSDTIISVLDDNNIYTLDDLCSSEVDKITLHMDPNDIETLFNHYLCKIGIRLKNSKYLKDAIKHARYLKLRAEQQRAKKAVEEADRKQRAAEEVARRQKAAENDEIAKEATKKPKIVISYKPVSKPKIVVQRIKYSNYIVQYLYDLFYMLDNGEIRLDNGYKTHCHPEESGFKSNGLLYMNDRLVFELIHTRYEKVYRDRFTLSRSKLHEALDMLGLIDTRLVNGRKCYTRNYGRASLIILNEELARKCLQHPKSTVELLYKRGYDEDNIQTFKMNVYGKTHPTMNRAIYDFSSVSSKTTYSDIDYHFNSTEPEFVDYEYLNSIGIRYTPDSDDLYAE